MEVKSLNLDNSQDKIVENGHSSQNDVADGGTTTIGDDNKSENLINGFKNADKDETLPECDHNSTHHRTTDGTIDIHINTGRPSNGNDNNGMDIDIDEIGEDAIISFQQDEESQLVASTPINRNLFLLPKKSNLRKISKYENLANISNISTYSLNNYSFCSLSSSCNNSFLLSTPNSRRTSLLDPTPRKKIKIVEDNDLIKKEEDENETTTDSSSSETDLFGEIDLISGHTYQTTYNGEEMVWVSPPPAPLDFSLIHENIVRAARQPVNTKKFSVEVDMHFIDGEAINSLLDCKPLIISAGFFNFEQVCRQNYYQSNRSKNFIYTENASNLKCLDEGLNGDLIFPKDLLFNHQQKDDSISSSNGILQNGEENTNVFYFADIWVTSKGFREYILTKSQEYLSDGVMMTKGFVIQDSDGTRPKDYNSACGLLFSSYQLPKYSKDEEFAANSLPVEVVDYFGSEDDNKSTDITEISVSDEFVKNILAKTEGKGVHLLVADNPECINVHEYVREVRFQRKFYAECIIALLGVREGGSFVVKIFDGITLFTAGLIFLMHRCFRNMSIHKPQTTSSPHTAERFLVCTGKLSCETSEEILQFLLVCHNIVMKHEEVRRIRIIKKTRRRLEKSLYEVKQLVPLKIIIGHADFFEFLRLQNIRFTNSLIHNIKQLCASIPENCIWKLNDPIDILSAKKLIEYRNKKKKQIDDPQNDCKSLFKKFGLLDFSDVNLETLGKECLEEISKSRSDWNVFSTQDCKSVIGAHPLTLFVGLGEENVYYLDGSKFKPIHVEGLSLTKGTILFGTIAELFPIQNKLPEPEQDDVGVDDDAHNSSVILEFHVMDGISLSGQYIGDFPYSKRLELTRSYASVMNKSKDFDYLKCTVIKVYKPLVLKKDEPVVSSWIKSSVYMKQDIFHYPGSLRLTNFPENTSTTAMSVGGLLFYKTSGNILDCLKTRVTWDWTKEQDESKDGEEDKISVGNFIYAAL